MSEPIRIPPEKVTAVFHAMATLTEEEKEIGQRIADRYERMAREAALGTDPPDDE